MNKFQKLTNAFKNYYGEDAIKRLLLNSNNSNKPIILIGGHQLTGKSTMAKKISQHFQDGCFYSVGSMFRDLATSLNISVAEQSRLLREIEEYHKQPNNNNSILSGQRIKNNPLFNIKVDLELDYRTCQIIQGVESTTPTTTPHSKYSVIEGRQPALLGCFIQSLTNNNNNNNDANHNNQMIKVYVKCSAREKALRYLEREVGKGASILADSVLPKEKDLERDDHFSSTNLSTIANTISKLPLENIDKIISGFIENQDRDQNDRKRYMDIYGLDYEDKDYYDLVIDTTGDTSENNLKKALDFINHLKIKDLIKK
ncbi:hypothetical protein DFA_02216 [Cavenderia fasciculata]|uniref:(d)CMP kinase n=1 Tax=Cavenderia fasciculata TaxID=261658 RepID=F4PYU4_CACFS|nr:uncharacterized protein DFA_02216 [Cavenderia fasciculata]EGG18973.1 hypothetical protein DFA_02216 [Cavenderia fasciculata]|eukprot:XP_004357452.1 hypothetical protein DFA_02216 [Cavenderia fasciculata]